MFTHILNTCIHLIYSVHGTIYMITVQYEVRNSICTLLVFVLIVKCLLFSPGTLSCRGWMTEADVASRCPKNIHLTGPVGSETSYSLTTREKMSAV